jgi:serine/threonine protein kinase
MNATIEIQIENYNLLEIIHQDEIVAIYRAQRSIDQAVVRLELVAPLFAADEFVARRFKQVTGQLAHLEHPNIVRTYEAEQSAGHLYLVQDWVEGRSLAQVLAEEGPFSPARMQHITRQLASALDYAHQKSINHGNLSAGGVLLGPNDQVYLTDFGQTQALLGVNLMKQSYTASAPETMAPERVHGQGPSRHADLYALGVLTYQMLAGKPPFTGSPAAVLHAHAYKQPKPLYQLNPGIPVALSEVVGRMMSKGLELRYSTAAEFARALSVAGSLPKDFPTYGLLSKEAPSGYLIRRLGHGVILILLLVFMAAGLLLTGYWLGLSQQPILAQPPVVVNLPVVPVISQTESVKILPSPDDPMPTQPVNPTLSLGQGSAYDSLLPARIPALNQTPEADSVRLVTVVITPTPVPTPVPPTRVPAAQPTQLNLQPEAVIPAGKGVLVFYNPTGHDLVIDLTGPSSESGLIPPRSREQFILMPGRYQLIMHTPTGNDLPSRTLEFDLPEGQTTEKDYYTDYVSMR